MAAVEPHSTPTLTDEATAFFSGTRKLRPKNLEAIRRDMDTFVGKHSSRRIALMTSGGTTVPLELNTVRFLDNFSTGSRGALCSEQLLKSGYAVILLHRQGSSFPFLRRALDRFQQSPVSVAANGCTVPPAEVFPDGGGLEDRLLAVPFTTIFEYLFLLREACGSLGQASKRVVVMLAAAVSDFYLPESELATDKIQSRGRDGLSINLQNVPKLLGAVRMWLPCALVISFKLETNANILEAKAAGAIDKYGVDAVVSNLLQTRREEVTVVVRDSASEIHIDSANIRGDEETPVPVSGVASTTIRRGDSDVVDEPLIKEVIRLHDKMM
jgi:phosphopantothenate-cysteine ligase